MTIMVDPNVGGDKNTHHIKLTDSAGTEVGFVCQGKVYRPAVHPYPTMASQLRQGQGKHSDRVPPFEDIPLSDFSGGFPSMHYDEDRSKYLEGHRIDTSQPGRVMLHGRERYLKGIRDFNQLQPSGSTRSAWVDLYSGGTTSVTDTFTTSAIDETNYAADKAVVKLKKTGSPTGNVTVTLSDTDDSNASSQTYAAASVGQSDPYDVEFDWTGTKTLTHGTDYKIKVEYTGGDASNYISVYCVQSSSEPYYRVLDDTAAFNILPFEYRGGFYVITQPQSRANSKLYLLGTRGLADANTGNLDRLVDATKDFSSTGYNVAVGDLVRVVAGPGSVEDQPWRTVTASYDGYLEVSPDWDIEHTANTEYVVFTDTFEEIESFDYYVTDVAVTDRVIHLAAGPDDYQHRIRFGNDDGTWTFEGDIGVDETEEIWRSDKLLAIRKDGYNWERPVYDLYASRKMYTSTDLNYLNNVFKSRTATFWGAPYFYLGHLTGNKPWWDGGDNANVDIYADRGWFALEWNATFTTGTLCTKKFSTPIDMSEAEMILFSAYSDTALDAGDLTLTLGDGSDEWALDFPAISTGDDMHDNIYWYSIDLHAMATAPSGSDFPNMSQIDRALIKVAVDKNAVVKLKFGQDGFILAGRNANAERYELGLTEWVNGLVEYGGGAGQVTRKPWVGTNRNVYYIEDGQLKPIYLKEIEELEHYRNCELFVVQDIYLYFNQKDKIQRYYAGHLDNIGPDADYGLPSTRAGIPCSGAPYPGRIVVAVDAGSSGVSSVMYRYGHGWHEAYRAPLSGERIRKIHILAREDTSDQLFISEGSDILWVPLSLDPENDSDYEFTNFGHIITSRIYGGLRETEKYFHALTSIQEPHSSGSTYARIYADFKTSENTSWTQITDDFSTLPRERNSLSASNDTEGRWIQFRFRFETDVCTYSPILVSFILDALERLDSNNTYSYSVKVKAGYDTDLLGSKEGQTGEAKWTQIETWVDDPKPLTLNAVSPFEDGKLVTIEPERSQMVYSYPDNPGGELRIYQLTFIEVE